MFRLMPQQGLFESVTALMKPIAALAPGAHAYVTVRGLGLAHMDAALKGSEAATALLAGDVTATMAGHGVRVAVH